MTKQKSFTLIELLVVIVIIGILAGVIMISTSSSIDKAGITKSKVFEESIQNNLAANMISKWKFDGNTIDNWSSVPATNNGVAFSSSENCIDGECGFFDGVGYLSVSGDLISFSDNVFTLSFWINTDKNNQIISNGSGCIFSKGSGDFTNSPSNQKGIYLAAPYVMSGAVLKGINFSVGDGSGYDYLFIDVGKISNNKWHHVVAMATTNKLKIFLDNIEYSQNLTHNTDINSARALNIGRWEYVPTRLFKGKIDEFSIFDNYLNQSSVKKLYVLGLNSLLSNGNISNEEYNERINELAYDK